MRVPSRSSTVSGTGRSSPGPGRSPSDSVRPSSSANSGLPSVESTRRRSRCRGRLRPSRSCRSCRIPPRLNGPTSRRSTPDGPIARSSGDVRAGRLESRKRTADVSSRGAANSSTSADGRSSHCTSSIAIRRDRRPASARKRLRKPSAIARSSGGRPVGSARRTAISSARRCGVCNSPSSVLSTPSRRSTSPANASRAGASRARVESTRTLRRRAAAIPASQSVVLPIPGPPVRTSPREPFAERNSCRVTSSGSRPTGSARTLLTKVKGRPPKPLIPQPRGHQQPRGATRLESRR